jgi:hypothetical protein
MSAPDGIDFGRSRAVLIGTAAYTEGLEAMPAAANSLRRMEELLVGLCGWPAAAVTPFGDLSTGDRRLRKVGELIEEATDVLLLYYVGHGLLLPGDDLGLALTDTDTNIALRLTTTYRLSTLREQLRYHCRARLKLIILDCCFAGIATRNAQGPGDLANRIDHASRIEGTYTWTASRASQQAVYEDGEGGLTYFTKILHEVVASGIPGKPAWLTLADVDLAVAQRFQELPLPNTPIRPEPTRLAVGGLPGMFPFAPNAAPIPVHPGGQSSQTALHPMPIMPAAAGRPSPRWVRQLFNDALAEASFRLNSVSPESGYLWRALLATDPVRAADLVENPRGEATPRHIYLYLGIPQDGRSDPAWRLLADAAQVLAPIDPYRAERLDTEAERLVVGLPEKTDNYRPPKISRLAYLASKAAGHDPDRARRLAAEVEERARTAVGEPVSPGRLAIAAAASADIDPVRAKSLAAEAEQLARSLRRRSARKSALNDVMECLASVDPERVERLLKENADLMPTSRIDRGRRTMSVALLGDTARALAERDPAIAERFAQLFEGRVREKALSEVAGPLGALDAGRAVQIARSISEAELKVRALAHVALVLAAMKHEHAGRLLDDAERLARSIPGGSGKAIALASIAEIWADSPQRPQ